MPIRRSLAVGAASVMHNARSPQATHAVVQAEGTRVRASKNSVDRRGLHCVVDELCAPRTSHVASVTDCQSGLDRDLVSPESLWIRHCGPSRSIMSA
jgi:hypothetical protein